MRKTIIIGVISAALATACTGAFADVEVKVLDPENAASLFTVEELADASLMKYETLPSNLVPDAFVHRMPVTPGAGYAVEPVTASTSTVLPFGGAAGHSATTGIRALQT